MSMELRNVKQPVYGRILYLEKGCDGLSRCDGLSTLHDLRDMARELQDVSTRRWCISGEYTLEMSYEMAEAVKQQLPDTDQPALQRIIDEAKAWGNYSVMLEAF